MGATIEAIKSGRYNESEAAKMLMSEQQSLLREDLETIKDELETLRKENANLKVSA